MFKPFGFIAALAAVALATHATAQIPGGRPLLRNVTPAASPSADAAPQGGCAPGNRLGQGCVSNPIFTTYLGAALQCSGHMLSLAEMYAFKHAHPEAKGIECSSDWNAATGTIYCVDDKGSITGSGLQNQAEGLGKNTLLFRCLLP